MLIAISSDGESLSDRMNERFGRCPWFLIVDIDRGEVRAVPNSHADEATGAGVGAAQEVISNKVEAIISGAVGPQAFSIFQQVDISVYLAPKGLTCAEAMQKFKDGKLEKMALKVF
jgi:predicted Fe-Mo cluster-binding NifX family protein